MPLDGLGNRLGHEHEGVFWDFLSLLIGNVGEGTPMSGVLDDKIEIARAKKANSEKSPLVIVMMDSL
jgi:hypothetical protein